MRSTPGDPTKTTAVTHFTKTPVRFLTRATSPRVTLSPNGKESAYVFRGEIFVSSVDGGTTKRITNTPWQERSVHFSPDGRSLVYAAERDSSWNVYTTTIARKEEPYFSVSWRTPDGKFGEGNQFEPDIKVRMDPAIMTAGRDQQIEAAVKELMKKTAQ